MTERYELVEYSCIDGSCLMLHDKIKDSKIGALSLSHKSVGEAIVEEMNKLYNESANKKIKEFTRELSSRINDCFDEWFE